MQTTRSVWRIVLVVIVAAALCGPAAAVSPGDATPRVAAGHADAAPVVTGNSGNGSVNVTVGQQLSTIIGVSSDEVRTEVENTAFEVSIEGADDEERAAAIADRAEDLRDEAEEIREDYEAATEAYRDGELDESEYAQRLATLNARASNLLESHERLEAHAANVSALELRAAGVDRAALDAAVENLSAVSGTGPAALLERFTGASQGEIEIESRDGVSIEVEGEDGERSREVERPRDGDDSITVNQSAALETARAALSTQSNATWALEKASVHEDDGYYKFEFALRAADESGEAEVRVDGSSGDAFRVEEEIEPADEDDDGDGREVERPRDDDDSITVNRSDALETARAALSDQGNATWALEEESVHNDSGYFEFEFALEADDRTGEAEVRVDGSSGEVFRLEEEFETAEREVEEGEEVEDDEVDELTMLVAEGTPDPNATVTLQVLADGAPAGNVTVFLNDRAVGTTDANGTVAVTLPASGEAELTAREGDAEAELEFEFEREEVDEVLRDLNAGASLDGDAVTVSVTYDGSGVANATVYANDRRVGTTGADGTVTFAIDANATDELEIEIVKGEFETELEYAIRDGSLVQPDGDGDESEGADDESDSDEEAETEDEEDEPDEEEEDEAEDDDTDSETDDEDDQ